MSAQHTPAPWIIRTYSTPTKRDLEGIFAADSRSPIVESVWGSTIDECDANARLIAAAPELLAVLQDLVRIDETAEDKRHFDRLILDNAIFPKIRAAIAKAEGR